MSLVEKNKGPGYKTSKYDNIFQVMKFIKKNRKDIKRAKSMRGKAES